MIDLGKFHREQLTEDNNTNNEIKHILLESFSFGELLTLTLYPDYNRLNIRGSNHIVDVDLKNKYKPQFLGEYEISLLLRECKKWDKNAYNTLRKFKSTDKVYILYYPDFKIIKISLIDNTIFYYIEGVTWSNDQ